MRGCKLVLSVLISTYSLALGSPQQNDKLDAILSAIDRGFSLVNLISDYSISYSVEKRLTPEEVELRKHLLQQFLSDKEHNRSGILSMIYAAGLSDDQKLEASEQMLKSNAGEPFYSGFFCESTFRGKTFKHSEENKVAGTAEAYRTGQFSVFRSPISYSDGHLLYVIDLPAKGLTMGAGVPVPPWKDTAANVFGSSIQKLFVDFPFVAQRMKGSELELVATTFAVSDLDPDWIVLRDSSENVQEKGCAKLTVRIAVDKMEILDCVMEIGTTPRDLRPWKKKSFKYGSVGDLHLPVETVETEFSGTKNGSQVASESTFRLKELKVNIAFDPLEFRKLITSEFIVYDSLTGDTYTVGDELKVIDKILEGIRKAK